MTWSSPIFSRVIPVLSCVLSAFIVPVWPDSPKPVCFADGAQSNPVAVSHPGSGAVFAWQDERSGNSDIYMQRLCGECDTLTMDWTKNGVPVCTAAGDQQNPVIVCDNSGNTIIVWEDNRNGNSAIYAQKVNASGVVQWVHDGVALCVAPFGKKNIAIAGDSAGGAIVTWEDNRDGSDISDIYAQNISKDGTMRWQVNGAAVCVQSAGQYLPQVICNAPGSAIVCWQDKRLGDFDIYAQRIDTDGAPAWTVNGVVICGALMYQLNPRMIGDGAGGAIIVWQDFRSTNDYNIFAQRIGADGVVKWTAGGLVMNNYRSGDQTNPVIVRDGGDGAIMAWEDTRGNDVDIYGQRVNLAGEDSWTSTGVPIGIAPGDQTGPRILGVYSGGAIVTWVDHRAATSDIYLQQITSGGILKSVPGGMAVCIADSNQNNPVVTSDGNDGAIVAWQDFRTRSSNIFTQIIPDRSTGILQESMLSSVMSPKGIVRIDQSGVVHYTVEHAGPVSLEIMDLSGRTLAKKVFNHQNPGRYSGVLSGHRMTGGTYLCRCIADNSESVYKVSFLR